MTAQSEHKPLSHRDIKRIKASLLANSEKNHTVTFGSDTCFTGDRSPEQEKDIAETQKAVDGVRSVPNHY